MKLTPHFHPLRRWTKPSRTRLCKIQHPSPKTGEGWGVSPSTFYPSKLWEGEVRPFTSFSKSCKLAHKPGKLDGSTPSAQTPQLGGIGSIQLILAHASDS